jgi:hypothetical protein
MQSSRLTNSNCQTSRHASTADTPRVRSYGCIPKRCYNCGDLGHIQRGCPVPRAPNAASFSAGTATGGTHIPYRAEKQRIRGVNPLNGFIESAKTPNPVTRIQTLSGPAQTPNIIDEPTRQSDKGTLAADFRGLKLQTDGASDLEIKQPRPLNPAKLARAIIDDEDLIDLSEPTPAAPDVELTAEPTTGATSVPTTAPAAEDLLSFTPSPPPEPAEDPNGIYNPRCLARVPPSNRLNGYQRQYSDVVAAREAKKKQVDEAYLAAQKSSILDQVGEEEMANEQEALEHTIGVTLERRRKGRRGRGATYDLTPFLNY